MVALCLSFILNRLSLPVGHNLKNKTRQGETCQDINHLSPAPFGGGCNRTKFHPECWAECGVS